MKYLNLSLVVILAMLSVVAGATKVMQAPQELSFFQEAGIATQLLSPFGLMQILGGLISLFPRFRSWGLLVIAAMFGLSAMMILVAGNILFGLASVIPCGLALILHAGLFGNENSPQ